MANANQNGGEVLEALKRGAQSWIDKLRGKDDKEVESTVAKLPADVIAAMSEAEKDAARKQTYERLAKQRREAEELGDKSAKSEADEMKAIEAGWDPSQRKQKTLTAGKWNKLCPSCGSRHTKVYRTVGQARYRKCEQCAWPFKVIVHETLAQ